MSQSAYSIALADWASLTWLEESDVEEYRTWSTKKREEYPTWLRWDYVDGRDVQTNKQNCNVYILKSKSYSTEKGKYIWSSFTLSTFVKLEFTSLKMTNLIINWRSCNYEAVYPFFFKVADGFDIKVDRFLSVQTNLSATQRKTKIFMFLKKNAILQMTLATVYWFVVFELNSYK